ncbi:MAG: 23S rRNA (pseudouridine(1915)-N(3))-methyltransferase RlmH [Deltaproteobacteria bacterium]|nr:23S rRNA (pseudouridine(1915)-N(3))-methyltransferase RlmH [Deltaproteobacteria bacterium]
MPRKKLRIIAVGALRAPHWKAAAAHYLERLQHWRHILEHVVKDADAGLPESERVRQEGQRLLQAVRADDYLVCLDERGTSLSSRAFAAFLDEASANASRTPCFVLGGPFGLAGAVRARAGFVLSLGPMTLPHELARVVLLEQLYRAEAILRKTPYHHGGVDIHRRIFAAS